MSSRTITKLFSETIRAAIPRRRLNLSEWADSFRFLSGESSAAPGRWRTDLVPYQRGIMDEVSNPETREVVFMASAQVGKTEILLNAIGYFCDADPSPIMLVQPTLDLAKAFSKDRLSPMIRDTPALEGLFEDPRTRDSGNEILHKNFTGGQITLAGANSAVSLRSRPIRVLLLDEEDGYPIEVGSEGDPVLLAKKRTTTFGNKKIIHTSTPTVKGISKIEAAYEATDQRKYFVPCPDCDEYQVLEWKQVQWDEGKEAEAYYVCLFCGAVIDHDQKAGMLARGRWEATAEGGESRSGAVGFWLWEGYSPWVTWGEMALAWREAKKRKETLRGFINTSLGQSFEDFGEAPEEIDFHREEYPAQVPDGVLVLTAGIDTQDDRIEVEVVGWGLDEESWSIDYRIFYGDPSKKEIWAELLDYLRQTWTGEGGREFTIQGSGIDSGGHHTNDVYWFAKRNAGRRVFALKGSNAPARPIASKPSIVGKMRVRLFSIGTDTAKDRIFAHFKTDEPGPGFCHFPDTYEDAHFKQLTAEKVITKFVRGYARRVWTKISDSARNEALDCRVYALAAREIRFPNWKRSAEVLLKRLGAYEDPEVVAATDDQADEPEGETTLVRPAPEPEEDEPTPAPRVSRPGRSLLSRLGGRNNFATAWKGR